MFTHELTKGGGSQSKFRGKVGKERERKGGGVEGEEKNRYHMT